ncbi:MAG: helix-turn-helix domain-containing protein [Candidatus Diapherotrites archaeon]
MAEDPFPNAAETLERKHFLSISRELLKSPDPLGFNAFLKGNPQITPRILSTRLKEMEKDRIITKSITMAPPMKIEYRLTARGRALKDVIAAINKWGKGFP